MLMHGRYLSYGSGFGGFGPVLVLTRLGSAAKVATKT